MSSANNAPLDLSRLLLSLSYVQTINNLCKSFLTLFTVTLMKWSYDSRNFAFSKRKYLSALLPDPIYYQSIQVNVLLTELYPKPDIVSASRNASDLISVEDSLMDDYLVSIQKMTFDEADYPADPILAIESMSLLASTSTQVAPMVTQPPQHNSERVIDAASSSPAIMEESLEEMTKEVFAATPVKVMAPLAIKNPPFPTSDSFTRAQQRKTTLSISTVSTDHSFSNEDEENELSSFYDSQSENEDTSTESTTNSRDKADRKPLSRRVIATSSRWLTSKQRHLSRDRYISKDISSFKRLSIPFSYMDVVTCSNEDFRFMKNYTGLKSPQLNAMLGARRRAANRQAAEKCRQSKMFIRDTLSQTLDSLHLERQSLNKKIISIRHKRQEFRDQLYDIQQKLIKLLRTPEGNEFPAAEWRVHTVGNEVVLMPAPTGSGSGSSVGCSKSHQLHDQRSNHLHMMPALKSL